MRRSGYNAPSEIIPIGTKNLLRNGDGVICQRGSSISNADNDDYLADGWILQSETASSGVTYTQETTNIPTPGRSAITLTVASGGADTKFGIFQPISSEDTYPYIDTGGTVHLSLSFDAAQGSGDKIASIYGAIVSWDGTADTITSDIVDSWGDSATAPTLITSPDDWRYEGNTPVSLGTPVVAYTRYKVEGVAVNTANVKNIGVFIWQNDTTEVDVGDRLYISNVMLNVGKLAAPFERRLFHEEMTHCERYFQSTYENGVVPGTATEVGRLDHPNRKTDPDAGDYLFHWRFPTRMRSATPTVKVYSTETGTVAKAFASASGGGDKDAAVIAVGMGTSGVSIQVTEAAGNGRYSCHATADADL